MSAGSARSYERVLEEDQPRRLISRQGSQRAKLLENAESGPNSRLSHIGGMDLKEGAQNIAVASMKSKDEEPNIVFNETAERASSIMS